jgi:hypothetical protein
MSGLQYCRMNGVVELEPAMNKFTAAVRQFAVALVLLGGVAQAQAQSIQIIPSAPRYLEPVYLRLTTSLRGIVNARVSMLNGTLVVDYDYLPLFYPPNPNGESFEASLGSFPAGTYTVNANTPEGQLTTQFTVAPKASGFPPVNFTGMWWNPQESGWGMSVFHGPTNELFAVWFVYDASGAPTWYTLQPGAGAGEVFSGPIYRTTGPYFAGPFDPSRVKYQQVGNGTLTFTDSAHARFRYAIDGQTMADETIQRQSIE